MLLTSILWEKFGNLIMSSPNIRWGFSLDATKVTFKTRFISNSRFCWTFRWKNAFDATLLEVKKTELKVSTGKLKKESSKIWSESEMDRNTRDRTASMENQVTFSPFFYLLEKSFHQHFSLLGVGIQTSNFPHLII